MVSKYKYKFRCHVGKTELHQKLAFIQDRLYFLKKDNYGEWYDQTIKTPSCFDEIGVMDFVINYFTGSDETVIKAFSSQYKLRFYLGAQFIDIMYSYEDYRWDDIVERRLRELMCTKVMISDPDWATVYKRLSFIARNSIYGTGNDIPDILRLVWPYQYEDLSESDRKMVDKIIDDDRAKHKSESEESYQHIDNADYYSYILNRK